MPNARSELEQGEWLVNRALGDFPAEIPSAALHLQHVQAKAAVELVEVFERLLNILERGA